MRKMGVICLVMMFPPELWSLKCQKKGLSLVFSADDSKKLVTDWAKYLSALERSY